jgi:hypothetical protein
MARQAREWEEFAKKLRSADNLQTAMAMVVETSILKGTSRSFHANLQCLMVEQKVPEAATRKELVEYLGLLSRIFEAGASPKWRSLRAEIWQRLVKIEEEQS